MKDFYKLFIEKPIQPLVKLLRNNGFNTIASCGHRMWVNIDFRPEWSIPKNDMSNEVTDKKINTIKFLEELLRNNGHKQYRIMVEIYNDNYNGYKALCSVLLPCTDGHWRLCDKTHPCPKESLREHAEEVK